MQRTCPCLKLSFQVCFCLPMLPLSCLQILVRFHGQSNAFCLLDPASPLGGKFSRDGVTEPRIESREVPVRKPCLKTAEGMVCQHPRTGSVEPPRAFTVGCVQLPAGLCNIGLGNGMCLQSSQPVRQKSLLLANVGVPWPAADAMARDRTPNVGGQTRWRLQIPVIQTMWNDCGAVHKSCPVTVPFSTSMFAQQHAVTATICHTQQLPAVGSYFSDALAVIFPAHTLDHRMLPVCGSTKWPHPC
mmetsp:Transcript_125683/g.250814  ORF Transcript_125683/g.250814 Transcript_125683/m.250814 type:complete len:244 (+) Transcript_125683:1026-1757(+)